MKSIQYIIITFFCAAFCACSSDDDSPARNRSPFVMSVSPVQGQPKEVIRIQGRNFSGIRENNEVMFNDLQAVVIEANSNELQVVVPSGVGQAMVHVRVGGQEAQGAVPAFTYLELTDYAVVTLAGSSNAGLQDGTGPSALFRNPEGVAITPGGDIIVTDRANNSIRKVTDDGVVTTILGNGTSGFSNGDVSVATLAFPWKSCVDKNGNIFIADRDNHAIRKIDISNGLVSTVAGAGTAGFADGAGAQAKFNQPLDVAVDGNGVLYVADNNNHRIRKISPEGVVSTLAGGTAGFKDGDLATALFRNPSGLTVGPDGNVYIADRLNHRIRKIDITSGQVTTVAGAGTTGTRDGIAAEAQFNNPYGIEVGEDGAVVIADLNNNKIRMIEGGTVTTIAGSTTGFLDGAGILAKFNSPTDIAIHNGIIYVPDLTNHRIRKIYKK
ncbi:IPT/TIG domain-containing protein [Fulvivirgaceae bacterium PWU4]|uniref:IPT/TIG domain-containing protein n=1 Tax=Chryseosolibacter histidini TaxID=2782349 RepID=A0AAP2DHC9_9BACT|nr:IPT/TIG domain-containing protein [Chryseosolibacter histidini]MBT1695413.1 IPT/TIG domain-containing protein [Chryseosolibacter histidini]